MNLRIISVLAALLLAALPVATPAQPAAATVHIKNFKFVPATLNVAPGTDRHVRQRRSANRTPSPPPINRSIPKASTRNQKWTHTFAKAGTFAYFCEMHPYMHGTVDREGSTMKRASFLEHVGWTGGGIAFRLTATGTFAAAAHRQRFHDFVQISDSHIGFALPANPDVAGTLNATVDQINALPQQPAFVMHTGDVTHLSKAEQFDTRQEHPGAAQGAACS